MASWWRHGGVLVAPWWQHGGVIVALWWRHGGVMVALVYALKPIASPKYTSKSKTYAKVYSKVCYLSHQGAKCSNELLIFGYAVFS